MRKVENLKNGHKFKTDDEATKEAAKRGGIISGQQRRKRKAISAAVEDILSSSLPESKLAKQIVRKYGLTADEAAQTVILTGIMIKASQGDVKAAEFLYSLIGETPDAKMTVARLKLEKQRLELLERDIDRKIGKPESDMPIVLNCSSQ